MSGERKAVQGCQDQSCTEMLYAEAVKRVVEKDESRPTDPKRLMSNTIVRHGNIGIPLFNATAVSDFKKTEKATHAII